MNRRNMIRTLLLTSGALTALQLPNIPRAKAVIGTEQTASYIIYVDTTGTINAENGSTGNIDYFGSDTSTVIQNAINALTSGSLILIKPSIYTISTSIVLKSGISLVGCGIGATILKLANLANVTVLRSNGNDNGILVSNLEINGNKANQTTIGGPRGISLGEFAPLSNAFIENVYVHHCKSHGVVLRNALDSTVLACTSSFNDGDGFKLGDGTQPQRTRRCSIENCAALQNQDTGFILDTTDYCSLVNCRAENVLNGVPHVGIQTQTDTYSLISSCLMISNEKNFIAGTISPSRHLIIDSCVSDKSGEHGFLITTANYGGIRNSEANNSGQAAPSSGITTNSTNLVISGNRCVDDQAVHTQQAGINFLSGSDYIICMENICRGNTVVGISGNPGLNSILVKNITA